MHCGLDPRPQPSVPTELPEVLQPKEVIDKRELHTATTRLIRARENTGTGPDPDPADGRAPLISMGFGSDPQGPTELQWSPLVLLENFSLRSQQGPRACYCPAPCAQQVQTHHADLAAFRSHSALAAGEPSPMCSRRTWPVFILGFTSSPTPATEDMPR